MNTIKITPNLLFEYRCTSGKFIRLPNRIEKIDAIARIESNRNFFCPNWNALVSAHISVYRSHSPAAAACGEFAAVGLAGKRHQSTAVAAAGNCGQCQVVSVCR